MKSRETIFVRRKAEDRPPEPEGYLSLCAQGQNRREWELNGKLWKTVPPSHLVVVTEEVITMS